MSKDSFCQLMAWGSSAVVAAIAVVAWGQTYDWQLTPASNYMIFPLLGLLAFSLMWSHYAASSLRLAMNVKPPALSRYFTATGWAVLLLILLHPGLLIYQRFRDGYGLPPNSYLSYVAPSLRWVVFLGVVSLLAFLAFELRRWYDKKSWWPYVAGAGDLAMLAIFYHGLRLGGQLQQGWFKTVWWFYGASLVIFLIHKYYVKYRSQKAEESAI